jgi:NADH-quinone oxidoreductase subunit E
MSEHQIPREAGDGPRGAAGGPGVALVEEEAFDYAPLDELIAKYRGTKGALIPLLQGGQAVYGYLPRETMVHIAAALGEPLSAVYGVATFYAQFRLVPRGRNVVRVCHGTACHVSGAPLVSQEIERHLGIADGGNTEDMFFTLESVACLGACGMAPVMMINDRTYGKLTPDRAVGCIVEFRTAHEGGNGNGGSPAAETDDAGAASAAGGSAAGGSAADAVVESAPPSAGPSGSGEVV